MGQTLNFTKICPRFIGKFFILYILSGIPVRIIDIAKHGHIVNERHNAFITEYLEGIERGGQTA
jgi:hypothetical protein